MKNTKAKNHNLDLSYESFKYSYQKNKGKSFKNKFPRIDNNYNNYQNIYRNQIILNKSNHTNGGINNHFINNLRLKSNKTNVSSKVNNIKKKDTPIKRHCNTPDRNAKYNLGSTPNKNNISLLKIKNRNDRYVLENNNTNKKEHKYFLDRKWQKYKYLSNERKRQFTPDKTKKSNFVNNRKLKGSESSNYYKFYKSNYKTNFSKSFQDSNYQYSKDRMNNYNLFGDSSLRYNKKKEKIRKKTPDKLSQNLPNINYKYNSKIDYKLSNSSKTQFSNNTSQIKFSKSFCSKNKRNERNSYDLIRTNEKNYILSNSYINSNKKYSNIKNKTNILLRSKSSNYNLAKNKNYNLNDNSRQIVKYKNMRNNNKTDFEYSTNNYKNIHQQYIKNTFNNSNFSRKINDFNFSTNCENYHVNKSELTFSQKKANKDLGKYDYPQNYDNTNNNSFFEKPQLNTNKLQSNKKYKFNGINNYMTKSSTNTYDEINSSNSIISKNTILDSIEEIHFNFVNVVQSSRNLMKMEKWIGERVINNDPNSSIILVEERDID